MAPPLIHVAPPLRITKDLMLGKENVKQTNKQKRGKKKILSSILHAHRHSTLSLLLKPQPPWDISNHEMNTSTKRFTKYRSHENSHSKLLQTDAYSWVPLSLDVWSWKLSDITQFSSHPNKLSLSLSLSQNILFHFSSLFTSNN